MQDITENTEKTEEQSLPVEATEEKAEATEPVAEQTTENVGNETTEATEKPAEKAENKPSEKKSKLIRKKEVPFKDLPLWKKCLSIVFDVFCVFLVLFTSVFCFSIVNSKTQNTPAAFLGYNALKIVSPSMEASGFEVGDCVMVHSVKTDTLSVGDIIAFYSYNSAVNAPVQIYPPEQTPVYSRSIMQFFGVQTKEIITAAKSGARLTFHQIVGIYEDTDGTRYFKTRGTSNGSDDIWYVSEHHVLGIYVDSKTASAISTFINKIGSSWLLVVGLSVPILILVAIIIREFFKDAKLAKIEYDCVIGVRSVSDDFCVENEIGFNMETRTKYEVLANAKPEKRAEFVKYLWKEEEIPEYVKAYYLTEGVQILEDAKELLALDKECKKLKKKGQSLEEVAKYFEEHRKK